MTNPGRWWVFQPRGRRRPALTPLGVAWTVGFCLLFGLATAQALVWQAWFLPAPVPGLVMLVLAGSLGWTALKICVDGLFVRGAAWFTGIGWLAVVHLLTESPACGTMVFGAGLPGLSPGIAPCIPHQDFMAVLFVAAWIAGGPLATAVLSLLEVYRWLRLRRDPLHSFRLLAD
jgi:hypothetical protein